MWVCAVLLLWAVVAGTSAPVWGTTRTPIRPTVTPTSSLPDLVVDHAFISLAGFEGGCLTGMIGRLALHLCIKNQGGAAAGPFDIDVNDEFFNRVDGIEPGSIVCALGRYTWPHDTHAILDTRQEVNEGNEANNEWTRLVAIPTLPPRCTPTPTEGTPGLATETPTPTSTPPPCRGDCDGDRQVHVDELLLGVNIALGRQSSDRCSTYTTCGERTCVTLLVGAVTAALEGCR